MPKEITTDQKFQAIQQIIPNLKESNLNSIIDKIQGRWIVREEIINTFFDHKEDLQAFKDRGFKGPNFSSILNSSRKKSQPAIKDFFANKEKLFSVMDECSFSAGNVSSILNGAGSNIGSAIERLYNNKGNLIELRQCLGAVGFAANNLSSILHTAGSYIDEAIDNLYAEKGNLIELTKSLKEHGFEVSNISHILSQSGVKAGEVVKTLNKNKGKIIKLVQNGTTAAELTRNLNCLSSKTQEKLDKAFSEQAPPKQNTTKDEAIARAKKFTVHPALSRYSSHKTADNPAATKDSDHSLTPIADIIANVINSMPRSQPSPVNSGDSGLPPSPLSDSYKASLFKIAEPVDPRLFTGSEPCDPWKEFSEKMKEAATQPFISPDNFAELDGSWEARIEREMTRKRSLTPEEDNTIMIAQSTYTKSGEEAITKEQRNKLQEAIDRALKIALSETTKDKHRRIR